MPRRRTLAVVVLLLLYGAVGARQPAVRTAAPLPAPAASFAEALGLASSDCSRILVDVIRIAFSEVEDNSGATERLRTVLQQAPRSAAPETVPLPLDPSIWRDTLLGRDVPDSQLIAAILSDRAAALFYYGLASLDDETLAWLGPDRSLIARLLEHSGVFAAFGRSLRIKAGRVLVPGGGDADVIWEAIVGAPPTKPAAFVRRLFLTRQGRIAYFYDTIAHLDAAAQRFALAAALPAGSRVDRVRALADAFDRWVPDAPFEVRPFSRQPFDPAVTLSLLMVNEDGTLAGMTDRSIWETVFRNDGGYQPGYEAVNPATLPRARDDVPADAAWVVSRIHRQGPVVARRRLKAFLFAQRNFDGAGEPDKIVTALKGVAAFPALTSTLERVRLVSPALLAAAVERAASLSALGDDDVRRSAILQFQGALSIVQRAMRSGALSAEAGGAAVTSLVRLEPTGRGYEGRLAAWIRSELLPALDAETGDGDSAEDVVLAALAGIRPAGRVQRTIEWEGRSYVVDAPFGELRRLKRIRQRQRGASLDDALAAFASGSARDKTMNRAAQLLADTLASLAYAVHLGDPEGRALSGGNVAARHDFGEREQGRQVLGAWQIPWEEFGTREGWHVRGSLLGLEAALARLSLRRLDEGTMPPPPKLTTVERQMAALTVALMDPNELTDAASGEIAAAIGRGRARVAALPSDREQLARIASDAGLSAWRREALAWTLSHDPGKIEQQFSLLELMWLGAPRSSAAVQIDPWGACAQPLTGCLCLRMPRPGPAEFLKGRPAASGLAGRSTDVALQIALRLAELQLPAALAPGIASFAMQHVMEMAQPSHEDDWEELARRARDLDKDMISDFVAALAAAGPLRPTAGPPGRQQ